MRLPRLLVLLLIVAPSVVLAQSSPNLIHGQVPTPAQLKSYFAAKQDLLGYTPINGSALGGYVFCHFSSGCSASNTIPTSVLTGPLPAAVLPAITGDVSVPAGSTISTLSTVNANVGTFGSSTAIPVITTNAKGLVTAVSSTAVTFPPPGPTFLGGVLSSSAPSNNFATGISTSGVVQYGQPTINNLANISALSILGNTSSGAGPVVAIPTTGAGNAVLSASPVFSGDIAIIGAGLTGFTAAQRAPVFIWNDCNGTLPAGRNCGLQAWVGPFPTGTPGANNPEAALLAITNGNNRFRMFGLNIICGVAGAAEGLGAGFIDTPCIGEEVDLYNSATTGYEARNAFASSTSGTYNKVAFLANNSPAIAQVTAGYAVWSPSPNVSGAFYEGASYSRISDRGIHFLADPNGEVDAYTAFGICVVCDDSRGAVFAKFGNFTHSGAMIDTSSGAVFTTGFYRGSGTADTNVLFFNRAAFSTTVSIDAGVPAGAIKESRIDLNDRGDTKWRILRFTDDNFYIKNVASGNNVIELNGDTQVDPNPLTVAALPACNIGLKYGTRSISDSTATPVSYAVATGGGTSAWRVFCDGTTWRNI